MRECKTCGETKNKGRHFPSAVVEINNPEQLVLLRKVVLPATLTEADNPPTIGKYRNVILKYEDTGNVYIYSSDGIPTAIEANVPQEVLDKIADLEEDLVAETETRAAADEQLSEAITGERTAREAADAAEAAARTQAISDEASARTTADATLQSNIDTVASNLATEASTRADADTALGTRIDGVVSDLATETSNRQSADTTLQSNITAEATARTNADTTLQTNIDNLSTALTTETTNRTNADTALGARIDGVAGDLAIEATNRQTADANLQTAISNEATARANADTSLQTALSTETTARQTADTGLQSQIDAIVASSDVKDIVGTYVALQQYDTSTLGNNDIIKVLQDETHSDETTYYRWNTTTSTFTLIGEEGPYYTKSATDTLLNTKADKSTTYTKTEVDTALATKQDNLIAGTNISIASDGKTISATDTTYTAGTGLNLAGTQFSVDTTAIATQSDLTTGLAAKQNTLTAGANVQISNDTISATDTTYSPFTGTDGTTAGTAGLVPAPATADAGKVLGANGAWVTGGPTVVQTTGTSTTDVMSQNATTSMVYADPDTRYRVKIGYDVVNAGNNAIAIGKNAGAYSNYSISIGTGENTHGIRHSSAAQSAYTIAIGSDTDTHMDSDGSIAMGYGAQTSGGSSSNKKRGQIALGAYSSTSEKGEMNIGSSNTSYGYNYSNYRLLTGLYDPQNAHDAATKGYADSLIPAATFTTNEWNALWA